MSRNRSKLELLNKISKQYKKKEKKEVRFFSSISYTQVNENILDITGK